MGSFLHLRRIDLRSFEDLRRFLPAEPQRDAWVEALTALNSHHVLVKGLREDLLQAGLLDRLSASIHTLVLVRARERADLILSGTADALLQAGLLMKPLAEDLCKALSAALGGLGVSEQMILPRHCLPVGKRPLIQAILNMTPDSFYDGGRYSDLDAALRRADQLVEEGADLLDIGGESTRPGAVPVSEDEELRRVIPLIEALSPRIQLPLSIDTRRSGVARAALEAGAEIVNDVSGLSFDPAMASVASEARAALILMHMRGEPATMQHHTRYESLMGEIRSVLQLQIAMATAAGVSRSLLFVDPGIGFAKEAQDNLTILQNLGTLTDLGCPIVIGASRKSFLGRCFGWGIENRLEGSLACAGAAILAGAHMVRVHDVGPTRRVVDTMWGIRHARSGEHWQEEHVRDD